ncbi:hypothetical protein BH09SUM1_BH09SUM1_17160 [soil metagenome]
MKKNMTLVSAVVAAITGLAVALPGAVDYTQVSYEVVLSQATVDGLSLSGFSLYGVAVDGTGNVLYVDAQQGATPFADALIKVNLANNSASLIDSNLDTDPAVAPLPTLMNINSRRIAFEHDRLLFTNQGTAGATDTQIVQVNTTSGAVSEIVASQANFTPVIGMQYHSTFAGSEIYTVVEGAFSGGTGELWAVAINSTATGWVAGTIEGITVSNPRGLANDSLGNIYIASQGAAANDGVVTKVSGFNNFSSSGAVAADVTPSAFVGVDFNTISGFGIANGDWIFLKRGNSSPAIHIWNGTTLTTLPQSSIAAGLVNAGYAGSTFGDIPDFNGFAIRALSSTRTQVFVGARDQTAVGGWAVLKITFGNSTAVEDWSSY